MKKRELQAKLGRAERDTLRWLFDTPKRAYAVLDLAHPPHPVPFVQFQRVWAGVMAPLLAVHTTRVSLATWRAELNETPEGVYDRFVISDDAVERIRGADAQ